MFVSLIHRILIILIISTQMVTPNEHHISKVPIEDVRLDYNPLLSAYDQD
jgi:hypothetical protein